MPAPFGLPRCIEQQAIARNLRRLAVRHRACVTVTLDLHHALRLNREDVGVKGAFRHLPGTDIRRAYSPGPAASAPAITSEERHMSKGMDQKKEQKKKPAKTMKEKKAEKKDKKATKAFAPT